MRARWRIGLMLLALLGTITSSAQTDGLSGIWFDPALDGEGYNVVVSPAGIIIFYYGYSQDNERLWLVSELLVDPLDFDQDHELIMFEGQDGQFDAPAPPSSLNQWGTLTVRFNSCTTGTFMLSGSDGQKTSTALLLAGISGAQCNESQSSCDVDTGNQPDCLPTFKSLNLYASDSVWNTPIAPDATVDDNSPNLVQSLIDSIELVIQVRQYSAPVYFVNADTPRFDVDLACAEEFDLGVSRLLDVPIPSFASPSQDTDGAANPIPETDCGVDADQDNHMVLVDLERRCEWGFWQARMVNGGWIASVANNISMDSGGIYQGGVADKASGFAFLAGVIWPDELAAGQIDHALVFSYPFTRTGGPVPPATFSDGVVDSNNVLPMGARVRLDPELNLDELNLEPYERTIAEALQTFGMFLGDTGGSSGIGLYAVDPRSVAGNPYQGLLPDGDFALLDNIPINRFQVLTLGNQMANFTEVAFLENGPCSAFEFVR